MPRGCRAPPACAPRRWPPACCRGRPSRAAWGCAGCDRRPATPISSSFRSQLRAGRRLPLQLLPAEEDPIRDRRPATRSICSSRFQKRSAAPRTCSGSSHTTIGWSSSENTDALSRPHHGRQQFPAGKRLARRRQIAPRHVRLAHQFAQLHQQRPRFLILRQRQQRAVFDLQHRALRFHVEAADGFHLVAEQVDAHRLGGFRREHVQNAAAHRVFAHHLHRLAALVADAFQVRDHVIERQFVAHPQLQGELPVEIAGFDAQQRRGHRQDGDGHALGGQPPQADGALLADFGVRREVLQRQNIQRRKQLRAAAIVRRQQVEERVDGLGERFGLLVAIYYNYQRTVRMPATAAPSRAPWRWWSGRRARRAAAARADAAQRILKARMPAQVQKQISNGRMDQGWLRIISTILVVE